MANYWVITIGINQYRHFQPLVHAQNDALYLHRFFTETAGVPADHCVLLSDLSTSVGEKIVYPDKPMIADWVQTITHQVQADDALWFFFSGYGAQVKGENGQTSDYLMPIDGDPGQIESTGIAIAELINTLAELPTDRVLLALDVNRSQGTLSGQSIGAQVIDLARARSVSTLLSCQLDQYSHGRIFGIRPGLFTLALIEALRQKYKTVSQISHYVSQRLPELCEHHLRPIQNPMSIIAHDRQHIEVVPALSYQRLAAVTAQNAEVTQFVAAEERLEAAENIEATDVMDTVDDESVTDESVTDETLTDETLTDGTLTDETLTDDETASSSWAQRAMLAGAGATAGAITGAAALDGRRLTGGVATESPLIDPPFMDPPTPFTEAPFTEAPDLAPARSKGTRRSSDTVGLSSDARRDFDQVPDNLDDLGLVNELSDADASGISGARLRNWGLLALAILMGGVLLKQLFVGEGWNHLIEKIEMATTGTKNQTDAKDQADSPDPATTTVVPEPEGSAPALPAQAGTGAAGNPPTAISAAPSAPSDPASVQQPAAQQPAAQPTSVSPNSGNSESDKVTAQSLISQAKTALGQRQYSEALIALQQVPKSQRDESFSSVLTQARAGAAEAQQANASVLTEARTSIQPTQASQFTEAISKASLIQPGEPYYEAAQNDIRGWSQVILDIAEGRATSGNLESAIAAAKVMPYANAEYHQKAQDRIAFWQQRQQSRIIISEAQKIPKLGQASTYQQGIVKLRQVPIEHPEYEAAQRLADQWSESIFSIAQARAAQGREDAAIQAAVLVPAGTTAYEPIQQAIRRWRSAE